ncbi:hypothetical protein [Actinoplanes sp. NPDC051851]|uniref:hypothetical protein n=1 Tax=Actinoplanes sp. NPDC051851 TaxID=3154753 RepID=UPI00342FFAAC
MTTTLTPPGGLVHRVGRLRRHSPGRLQLILAALVTLGLLTGLVAGLTANAASTGTADLGDREQPLLVEAETIYTSLADADTTAAQAFLAGGLEPADLTRRYDADLARLATALTSASRRTPQESPAAQAVEAIAAGVAKYSALVATARADNRQGLPVGASYLSAASTLNRETLQVQAQALFQIAQDEVDAGYADARSSWWLTLLVALFAVLAAALIWSQIYLSRTTHRTFNVPLLAATAAFALLFVGAAGVFGAQRGHLSSADRNGSTPVSTLAELRIVALSQRADEALTLAARGGGGDSEAHFDAVTPQADFDDPALDDVRTEMNSARDGYAAYLALHDQVRELDDGGDYEGAVDLAVGAKSGTAFASVTDALDRAITDRKAAFTSQITSAGTGLDLLTVLGPLLALIGCVLAALGIRARLEEYR